MLGKGRLMKRQAMTAGVLAQGRDNNFNLIRMMAASAVIVSHSVPLSVGMGVHEPLHGWIEPLDLGKAAVRVFFVISGFFILQSFDRRSSTAAFALARAARILPALLVVSILTGIMTSVGVSFAGNPFPNSVNGSLWTLYYEVVCYGVLAFAGLCGLFHKGRFPAFLVAFGMVYLAIALELLPIRDAYAYLSLPFVFGMAVYHYRESVPLGWPLALGLLLLAIIVPSDATWSIALGYGALWFGATAKRLRFYNRFGDYSYGTYIFAWPVQQLIALSVPGILPLAMMLIALPVVWGLGVLSWHFVEHPAMDAAKRWARRSAGSEASKAFPGGEAPSWAPLVKRAEESAS